MIHYFYSDTELNKILKTLTIVVDTREQVNGHILDYFRQKDIPIKIKKLDYGDYSAMIPQNEELGIQRDIYLNSAIERKASIDEICGNLQKDTQTAFENELIRSQKGRFVLFVEDLHGYGKILRGDYRSRYDPKALLGRLKSFEAKYNFVIKFVDKSCMGNDIYHHFLYQMKFYLKEGVF